MSYTKPRETYQIIRDEPEEVYHGEANRLRYMSSHRLKAFRHCPLKMRQEQLGLIKQPEHEAMKIGTAAHKLILEGSDAYEESYCFGGPVNPRTNRPYGPDTKKFAEWQREQGKPCLSSDHDQLVHNLQSAVNRHDIASDLLSGGEAEVTVRGEMHGVECQIRIDYLVETDDYIIDLKTCRSVDGFEHGIESENRALERGWKLDPDRPQYVAQLAFYRELARRAFDRDFEILFVAVEKQPPYRVKVVNVEKCVDLAAAVNCEALEEYRDAKASDSWKTRTEEIVYL